MNVMMKVILLMRYLLLLGTLLVAQACAQPTSKHLHPAGHTVATRIMPPRGYTRAQYSQPDVRAQVAYLRGMALHPHGHAVLLHNGLPKSRQDVHVAVLATDVGRTDLQQCADAVMRIQADYWYHSKQYDRIHFNFTNGFRCDWLKYAMGYRVQLQGNVCSWVLQTSPDSSYASFRNYLNLIYTYAGSLSLSRELRWVQDIHAIQPGMVFIQGGSPGHAVLVLDVAENQQGEKIFLLAQSYMPAQEIHILKNPNDPLLSPWYSAHALEANPALVTPEWTFDARRDLKMFGQR